MCFRPLTFSDQVWIPEISQGESNVPFEFISKYHFTAHTSSLASTVLRMSPFWGRGTATRTIRMLLQRKIRSTHKFGDEDANSPPRSLLVISRASALQWWRNPKIRSYMAGLLKITFPVRLCFALDRTKSLTSHRPT